MAALKVNLRRLWFAPDGARYRPEENPHSFPAEWEELLPSTATVLPAAKPVEEPKPVAAKK